MKKKIKVVKQNGEVLFKGNILDLPIKEDFIIKKSIEIFDDDDPCIIHKSYVIKVVVDELIQKTNALSGEEIDLTPFKDDFTHFNFDFNNAILVMV